MSGYNIFSEVVAKRLCDAIVASFPEAEVSVEKRMKVNEIKDALYIRIPNINKSPVIYIDDLYVQYQNDMDIDTIVSNEIKFLKNEYLNMPDIPDINDEFIKERVVFQLINREQNIELLKNIPHREWNDLAIIYRVIINIDDYGVQSVLLDNDLAESVNIANEEQLFGLAKKNTEIVLPSVVRPLSEVLQEMQGIDNIEFPPENTLYIITNKIGVNGAGAVLYEENLHKLAQEIGTDLYLMPSSVHEYLAISTQGKDLDELSALVVEANMSVVTIKDRLSNQIYHYDKDLRKVTLATDIPQKSIEKYNITNKLR